MIKKISIENRWIALLLLFYFFGTLGIANDVFKDFFLPLTPLNLLLTLFIFFRINNVYSKSFVLLSVLIFILGFSVEALGVQTGILFGHYSYGNLFGFKIFETPVLIGVNWLFLSLSTYGITQYFTNRWFLLVLIPPLLMTGLDFIVEPVAMKLGFWNWENNTIPVQNYVMWLATSTFIHGLIYLFRPKIQPKISFVVYIVQLIFFGLLNLILT